MEKCDQAQLEIPIAIGKALLLGASACETAGKRVREGCCRARKLSWLPAARIKKLFFRRTPKEIRQIEAMCRAHETDIDQCYIEIGKIRKSAPPREHCATPDAIEKLIVRVRRNEQEIARLKARITQIRTPANMNDHAPDKTGRQPIDKGVIGRIRAEIDYSLAAGPANLPMPPDQWCQIAEKLLDPQTNAAVTAAAELGKTGHAAAMPILVAAIGHGRATLTTEIIEALMLIGDSRAIRIFIQQLGHSDCRVRLSCLRGLYQLGESSQTLDILVQALHDPHPKVRQTAAAFLGRQKTLPPHLRQALAPHMAQQMVEVIAIRP